MDQKDYYRYIIRSYQTDSKRQLYIHQLFNMLQDVAHQHAEGHGFGMQQLIPKQLFWVLARLTVQINRLPHHEDEVLASTWVKSLGGAMSEREFILSHNGEDIIRASSLWFCLASHNHRPVAVPNEIRSRMTSINTYAVPTGTKKIIARGEAKPRSEGLSFAAQDSDIDMVNHVNNTVYVRWVMDELRRSFPDAQVKEFTINYLSEVFLGEEVSVNHVQESDKQLFYQINKHVDNSAVCRTEIIFH